MSTQAAAIPGTVVPASAQVAPGGAQGVMGSQGIAGDAEVGSIKPWPAVAAPASWMIADGSAISRTLYPALFALIGTTSGAGDGSTTFNLPDLRSRMIIGYGQGTGLTNRVLAALGGEENHVLSVSELAVHSHTNTASQAAHTHTDVGHIHAGITTLAAQTGIFMTQASQNWNQIGANTATGYANLNSVTPTITVTNANAGSGSAHNVMSPFLVLVYIIKVSPTGGATAQAPIADSTQNGLLRQVSGNTTDFIDGTNNSQALGPVLWSTRLRSFNAVGNPNFEVDQRNTSNATTAQGWLMDRWNLTAGWQGGTPPTWTAQQVSPPTPAVVPGTNFRTSSKALAVTLNTQRTALGTTDNFSITQYVEGSTLRELISDVTSLSLLVYCTQPLHFSVTLRDSTSGWSLVNLCTIPVANVWTLAQLPALPLWAPSGSFPITPGGVGYSIVIGLAVGPSYSTAVLGTWQNLARVGAQGADNFVGMPVGTVFYCAFVQHEPGPLCTTLMDKPFSQNLDECQRYYQKTYDYGTPVGTASVNGAVLMLNIVTTTSMNMGHRFKKPMAKVPTMTAYATSNGAVNSANNRQNSAVVSVSSFQAGSAESPCYYLNTGGTLTLNDATSLHYTADTGW